MSKREPLLKHFVGKQTCVEVPGQTPGTKMKVCITGGKYGFSAWIVDGKGKNLVPVATGDARTTKQAIEHAKNQIRIVQTKRN